MEEQYITFETAKLAKEKGCKNSLGLTPLAFDCTQASLQKWLREVHNIHIVITLEFSESLKELWYYGLLSIKGNEINELGDEGYTTYELALEAALQEALKLI